MKVRAALIAGCLIVSACGTSNDESAATLPVPKATEPENRTVTTDWAVIDDRPSNDPTPSETLSIEDALLPDDAFPPPWEPQARVLDRVGYGVGENQTDCPSYWAFEGLLDADGGHAMWWVDGGNANHYVTRAEGSSMITALLDIATIPTLCPTVNWNEGGSFTTETFPVDDAIGLRFTDLESGDVTWIAITTFGDLVSILHVPLWTIEGAKPVDFTVNDLSLLASQMSKRLRAARPIATPSVETSGVPPTTTKMPTATTVPKALPPRGLDRYLVDVSELPDGFEGSAIDPYRPGPPDEDLLADCPAMASIAQLDTMLQWEASFFSDSGFDVEHVIGRASSPAEAADVIMLFAEVASCDLTAFFGPDAKARVGAAAIEGADAASSLVVSTAEGDVGDLVLVSIGDVVMVVSVGVSFEVGTEAFPVLDLELAASIATRAVARVRAG